MHKNHPVKIRLQQVDPQRGNQNSIYRRFKSAFSLTALFLILFPLVFSQKICAQVLSGTAVLSDSAETAYSSQQFGTGTSSPVRQTLFGWEEETRLMIMNRYHSHGGIFYDRGLFRFTTPTMTKEHELDMISYNFTQVEQHDWYYGEGNSFRTFMGSYNLGKFLHGAEIRNHIQLTDRLSFPLHMVRRFDMRTDRTMLLLSFDYELSEFHQIGLRHTLNEQKPDFDASLYYQLGHMPEGGVRLELTALDWANNPAYELGQRRGTEIPELRRYEHKPYLFSFRANSPVIHNLRMEASAGIQTPLTAIAESMPERQPGESFRDRDLARYAGVLLEYALPNVTGGLSFRHKYARFSRTNAAEFPGSPAGESGQPAGGQEAPAGAAPAGEFGQNEDPPLRQPVDYGNRQIENSLGAFLGLSHNRFYMHNWVWRNYNRDDQWDDHEERMLHGIVVYPFDFREFRWKMQFRLGYNPDQRGFTTSVEWSSDYRHPTENYVVMDGSEELHSRGLPYRERYPNTIGLRNERLTLQFGYRFSEHTYLILGASFDVDGDRYGGYWDRIEREDFSRFDGGFGRFVIYY